MECDMTSDDLPEEFHKLCAELRFGEYLEISVLRLSTEGREMAQSVEPFSRADFESWMEAARRIARPND
jgi:hypothetical protein